MKTEGRKIIIILKVILGGLNTHLLIDTKEGTFLTTRYQKGWIFLLLWAINEI